MTNQILMARQPIMDQNLRVVAYELLYRDADSASMNRALFDGQQATTQVLLNSYTGIFDAGRFRRLPAFININQEMLESGDLPSLPRDGLVLEILEDVQINDTVIKNLRMFAEHGYRIALDDYVHDERFQPLLELAHIIKLDVLAHSTESLTNTLETLKPYKLKLLAEKVETHEQMQRCMEMGFDLFQGYFLSRPQIVSGRKLSANSLVMLELLAELDNDKASPDSIERIVSRDPELTIKILKIVNSSGFNLNRHVASIAEAVVIIGLSELKKWAMLIAFARQQHKPSELSRQLLVRAHMCDLLAQRYHPELQRPAFMVGILSGLDALLDLPLDVLLPEIPLREDIKQAITHKQGELGQLLEQVIAFMNGNWDTLSEEYSALDLSRAQVQAFDWASDAMQTLTAE